MRVLTRIKRVVFAAALVCFAIGQIAVDGLAQNKVLQAFNFPLADNRVVTSIFNIGMLNERLLVVAKVNDNSDPSLNQCLLYGIHKNEIKQLAEIESDCSLSYNSYPKGFEYQRDGNQILIRANLDPGKRVLWLTDGSPENTRSIKDDFEQNLSDLLFKGKIFSSVLTSYERQEGALFVREGERFEQLLPNAGYVYPLLNSNLVVISSGFRLYVSDGTIAGTNLIFEGNSSMPLWSDQRWIDESQLGTYGFLVNKSDGSDGATLLVLPNLPIVTDGTVEGTFAIDPRELVPDCDKSLDRKNQIIQLGDALLFTRCDGAGGRELISYSLLDRTLSKIAALPDTENQFFGSRVNFFESKDPRRLGRLFIFNQKSPDGSLSLWRTNGTSAGTYQILDRDSTKISDDASSSGDLESLFQLNGHLYLRQTYGSAIWVSDGSKAGSYKLPKVFFDGFSRDGQISASQGFVQVNQSDYLMHLFNPELPRVSEDRSLSLIIHNPLSGKEATMLLLAYAGSKFHSPGRQVRIMESDSSYIIGLVNTQGHIDFYSMDKDLCPDDPLKEIPGFCGCGVEEQQLEIEIDKRPNLNAAVCQTPEGNALLNLEAAPTPKVVFRASELLMTFPANILEKLAANLDLASANTSIVLTDNKRLSKKVNTQVRPRIIQVNAQSYRALRVRQLKNGKFSARIPKGSSRNASFAYEYGFKSTPLKGRNPILSVASVKKGRIQRGNAVRRN